MFEIKGAEPYIYLINRENEYLFPDGSTRKDFNSSGYFSTKIEAESMLEPQFELNQEYTMTVPTGMSNLVIEQCKKLNIVCREPIPNAKSVDFLWRDGVLVVDFYLCGKSTLLKEMPIEKFFQMKNRTITFQCGGVTCKLGNQLEIGGIKIDPIKLKEQLCQYVKS